MLYERPSEIPDKQWSLFGEEVSVYHPKQELVGNC